MVGDFESLPDGLERQEVQNTVFSSNFVGLPLKGEIYLQSINFHSLFMTFQNLEKKQKFESVKKN